MKPFHPGFLFPFLSLPVAAMLLLPCPGLHAQTARHLEFAITKGTNPDGSGAYSGRLVLDRTGPDAPFKASWTLSNGTASGWAVPFPGTDYLAVGYGKDLGAIVIYQRQKDGSSKAQYCTAAAGERIKPYTLAPAAAPGQFTMKDGAAGSVSVTPGVERAFDLSWTIAGTTWQGMGVADGDYLAAASTTGGKDYGVVIYKKSADGASGWWRYGGATGVGTENLRIASVDGAAADPAAAKGAALSAEVLKLARSLRTDGALLQKLQPTAEQIGAIAATREDAARLADYVTKVFADLPATGLPAKDGQTVEVVVAPTDLPGGYRQQAVHFSDRIAIYGFKYVAPGETSGMAYDGLVLVEGKWVMIPKMWRAFAQ